MINQITLFFVIIILMTFSGCSSVLQSVADSERLDEHSHTPHVGIMVPFFKTGLGVQNSRQGFAELKLHDDKGDLELWLTNDDQGVHPFDLPLDSVITVSFTDLADKSVKLKVRNKTQNEDEDGVGNIRSGQTNYFIFPGETGVDASFLMGKDFSAQVVISFLKDGVSYITLPFELYPHTH